ncbi:transposase [Myxococcaceae bacterium JPH2]|nr:transposase [Myxococcaceae bacterium JPH2]
MGHLEVAVPRTRASGAAGAVLGHYKRRSKELDEAITSAYVKGVSMSSPTAERSTSTEITEDRVSKGDGRWCASVPERAKRAEALCGREIGDRRESAQGWQVE